MTEFNLKAPNRDVSIPALSMETDPGAETFLVFRIRDDGQGPKAQ
jgi:hypothetical protein